MRTKSLRTLLAAATVVCASCLKQQGATTWLRFRTSLKKSQQRRKLNKLRRTRHGNPRGRYMYNLMPDSRPPLYQLEPVDHVSRICRDPGREYFKVLTTFCQWEFFALAEKLEQFICRPRSELATRHRTCKMSPANRLFWCLRWLISGETFRAQEYGAGRGKSTLNVDLKHILLAIIEGLGPELQWPSRQKRQVLAGTCTGIFRDTVGIMDITEIPVQRSKDPAIERDTYSKKKAGHTRKTISVIDFQGYFTFVHTGIGGSHNDREMWTECPLYYLRSFFFEGEQVVACDGGFKGDGPLRYSWDNPGADTKRQLYNVAFNDFRKYKENSYGRVKAWFPILGRRRHCFDSSREIFVLTVHACFRMHNWLMRVRNLNYSPASNPALLFRKWF